MVEHGKIVYMKNGRKFEGPPSAVKLNSKFIILFLLRWSALRKINLKIRHFTKFVWCFIFNAVIFPFAFSFFCIFGTVSELLIVECCCVKPSFNLLIFAAYTHLLKYASFKEDLIRGWNNPKIFLKPVWFHELLMPIPRCSAEKLLRSRIVADDV